MSSRLRQLWPNRRHPPAHTHMPITYSRAHANARTHARAHTRSRAHASVLTRVRPRVRPRVQVPTMVIVSPKKLRYAEMVGRFEEDAVRTRPWHGHIRRTSRCTWRSRSVVASLVGCGLAAATAAVAIQLEDHCSTTPPVMRVAARSSHSLRACCMARSRPAPSRYAPGPPPKYARMSAHAHAPDPMVYSTRFSDSICVPLRYTSVIHPAASTAPSTAPLHTSAPIGTYS
jgi:hypothetical protein